jgi:hypothetical protein
MNERIQELVEQAGGHFGEGLEFAVVFGELEDFEKFAESIAEEYIGILETEIELVKGYKSTACNDFDVRWHEGKIEHFIKIVEKSKKHFGVEE